MQLAFDQTYSPRTLDSSNVIALNGVTAGKEETVLKKAALFRAYLGKNRAKGLEERVLRGQGAGDSAALLLLYSLTKYSLIL